MIQRTGQQALAERQGNIIEAVFNYLWRCPALLLKMPSISQWRMLWESCGPGVANPDARKRLQDITKDFPNHCWDRPGRLCRCTSDLQRQGETYCMPLEIRVV
eukprot:NODE_2957_length_1005_cov_4.854603_g2473_i0.p3 GENE.NODE_2957_length_1005_cov_4.854603_g2473_i0~~NODE_2957_length_1005_cov_4.854603_g2473_i0.p3  ORF type:complete len:103 (+),score=4.88 NODE_2957_length_1005_cov_4.854603_g2473_i0:695-1003(+)